MSLLRLGFSSTAPIFRRVLTPASRRHLCLSFSPLQKEQSSTSQEVELDLNQVLDSVDSTDLSNLSSLVPEPSFASLGLAHGYPSGWVQALMETIHVDLGVPWWGTIVGSK